MYFLNLLTVYINKDGSFNVPFSAKDSKSSTCSHCYGFLEMYDLPWEEYASVAATLKRI